MQSRKASLRLHRAYGKKIQTACKQFDGAKLSRILRIIGDEFCDDFEDLLKRNISDAVDEGAKTAQHIIDQMLPKGVKPPGKEQTPDFWTREYKGETPEVRLARLRGQIRKKLGSVPSRAYREAPILKKKVAAFPEPEIEADYEAVAQAIWGGGRGGGGIETAVALMGGQDSWAGSVLGYASTLEDNNSVIDHWEHLATLDASTCEECAALDGTVIDTGGGDVEEEPWDLVDIHPNCRCVPVPVSKDWSTMAEELGYPGMWDDVPNPEGTRIARTDAGGRASPTGFRDENGNYHEWKPKLDAEGHLVGDNWRPGMTPTGGDQYYTDASVRYDEWARNNPAHANPAYIPKGDK